MDTLQRSQSSALSPPDSVDDRAQFVAAAVFTVAVLVHGADHARRGADGISADVFWAGTSAIALEVAVVVLVCRRHRLAPLVAAGAGWSLMVGYLVVHFLPARGWLSDSFVSGDDVSPLSWAAASLEVVAATFLGATGTLVLRRRGGLESAAEPHSAQRSLRNGLLHPVALAMMLGNAAVLVISFGQLS